MSIQGSICLRWVPVIVSSLMYTKRVKAQKPYLQSHLHPSNAMQMQFGRFKAVILAKPLSSFNERTHQRMFSIPTNAIHSKSPLPYFPSLTSCTLKYCPCTPCSCGIGGGGP